ncbi:hypothetical protein LUX39_17065 [Actinomadura madurae]|uniref:hypothetical protein n=1 Tax=Actinomadura madurae TaxID=1993 RepID=UPI0020D20E2F|nr:hypothetical protein [Actinomadura madurae]MCP9949802.1 hypothetical protein [Actinomadura madurae]MCQ0009428.1 hypothetical protein [Actinomadura madurae]MCQ0015227.1 hypothetical protein [Actinomadura madurae]
MTGRWVDAMRAASPASTSAQNCWWYLSSAIRTSLPPVDTGYATSALARVLPSNLPDSSSALSPGSGANAAT